MYGRLTQQKVDNLYEELKASGSVATMDKDELRAAIRELHSPKDRSVQGKKKAIGAARDALKDAETTLVELRGVVKRADRVRKFLQHPRSEMPYSGAYKDVVNQLDFARDAVSQLEDAVSNGKRAFKDEGINPSNPLDRHMKSKRGKEHSRMPKAKTISQSVLDGALRR